MTFDEARKEALKLLALFEKQNLRPWNIEALLIELAVEVGTLADSIMIKEKYRRIREDDGLDLEDDIADILFVLLLICNHYKIDIAAAYKRMLHETNIKLSNS